MIELTLANENPVVAGEGVPIYITGFNITHSKLCGLLDSDSIIGTEIKAQETFQINVCATNEDPPIASGVVTLSTLDHGLGDTIAKVEWGFSGTMSPNHLRVRDVHPPWLVHAPEIPPSGVMGPVTVTFRKGLLE